MTRWVPQLHYDFAARADWCITSNYESANHRPDITINEGLDLTAAPGEKVYLSATTSDPDGDNITVDWWHYVEAGTDVAGTQAKYDARLIITEEQGSDSMIPLVTFAIPSDAQAGDTFHIIATATDDGIHNLSYNQRVVVTIEQPDDIGMRIVMPPSVSENNDTVYSNTAEAGRLIWVEFDRPRLGVTVSWTSSNTEILTLSSATKYADTYHNVVTAAGTGTATITATASTGQVATYNLNVRMTGTVSAITLPTGISASAVPLGGPVQLNATTTLANGGQVGINWVTSDPTIATVDANGVLTPLKAGEVIVYATVNDGGGARSTLKVTIVPGVSINIPTGKKATAVDVGGGAFTLTANGAPVAVSSCTWLSSNEAVATVNASGLVTPLAVGSTTITANATLADGTSKTATLTLTLIKPVTGITITSPAGNTISANTTLSATCNPGHATIQTVRWYTSDPAIATVGSSNGQLVPRKAGTVTITAVANDGSGASGTINLSIVYKQIESITLGVPNGTDPDAIPVGGGTITLTPSILPADANKQTLTGWVSSNPAVATVNSSGVVTPVGEGKTTITVKANDGSGVVGKITLTIVS